MGYGEQKYPIRSGTVSRKERRVLNKKKKTSNGISLAVVTV